MPATQMGDLVADACAEWEVERRVESGSYQHSALVDRTVARFAVSKDAAAMRLLKLGHIKA